MQSQPQNTVNSQCSHETKRYICLVLDCLLLRVQSTAFANLCLNELCYFDVASIQTFLFFHTQGFTAILSELVKSVSLRCFQLSVVRQITRRRSWSRNCGLTGQRRVRTNTGHKNIVVWYISRFTDSKNSKKSKCLFAETGLRI